MSPSQLKRSSTKIPVGVLSSPLNGDRLTDILLAVDAGDLSALVLLNLSAAFDTVDHGILLQSASTGLLLSDRGISTTMVSILYLSNRLQHVRFGSSSSSPGSMVCGIPQGSVLGAILFFLYSGDLQLIIESWTLPAFICY